MFRRSVPIFALVSALALAVGLIPSTAVAEATDGNWWYGAYHVAQAHADGWTGKGVRIAVIDQQIDPSLPVLADASLSIDKRPLCKNTNASVTGSSESLTFHSSTIAALLAGNGKGVGNVRGISPGAHLMFYGAGVAVDKCVKRSGGDPIGLGIKRALDDGARVISISIAESFSSSLAVKQVARAISKGVVIVAAQPDTVEESQQIYPSSYNGVVAVNAVDADGALQTDGNTGKPDKQNGTDVVGAGVNIGIPYANSVGNGSSISTPLVAGMVANVWQKYPSAAGGQLIRSVLKNANKVSGSNKIWYGHGIASMTNMLASSPMGYSSGNPLWGKHAGAPSKSDVKAFRVSADRQAKTSNSGARIGDGQSKSGGLSAWIYIAIGVVVVIALVILLCALVRRRRIVSGGNYGR